MCRCQLSFCRRLRAFTRQGWGASLLFVGSVCLSVSSAFAADFPVASASDIASILSSLQPGDTVTMQDGTWTNQQIQFAAMGTASQPITLRAQTPGQVILNGTSSLNISGDWLVADGLNFNGGALPANDHVVEFRGSLGDATNSRLTNSAITNYNPSDPGTRYFWVSIYGEHNRVDHNSFEGQNHSGVTVTVWRNSSAANHHLIDNNYFANRPEGDGNGFETIRIGTSTQSLSSSFTTVENNVFRSTDGEAEIISNKSGNNTFRYNTFREAAGTLTLRHGDNNRVEGNFFLGEGKNATGGVRVIGEGQTIVNNYFEGLDGRAGGAISISAGVANSAANQYYQVKDAVIAHNTIVDVQEAAITFDDGLGSSDRTLLAENVTIANNLIRSTADPLFEGLEGSGWTWEGNIAYGQSLGPKAGDSGISVVDPQLSQGADGLWRPGPTSPAIDNASGNASSLISVDMDGQARIGLFDIGADEFSIAAIVRKPLTSDDVGYDWDTTNPPGTIDCSTYRLAIQAEDYSAIQDPNGDGDNWTVSAVSGALGGVTMVAPSGSRVDLPSDPHDAIVTYDVEFSETGTYTAYYRGRGFDGSSDSLYTPDDFDVDPNNAQTLTRDGIFTWEVGDSFSIGSSEVGVPLEFRIGMRESGAELDALVFHLDGGLNATELDALFSLDCPIDFNDDGLLDCSDLDALISQIATDSNEAAFDLDGDGDVNHADLTVWLADAGELLLGTGHAFLPGDANLDGVVNAIDFDSWNANRFTALAAWCRGDFNADGFVDVSDFNIWKANDGLSSYPSSDLLAVPEPAGSDQILLGVLLLCSLARRLRIVSLKRNSQLAMQKLSLPIVT